MYGKLSHIHYSDVQYYFDVQKLSLIYYKIEANCFKVLNISNLPKFNFKQFGTRSWSEWFVPVGVTSKQSPIWVIPIHLWRACVLQKFYGPEFLTVGPVKTVYVPQARVSHFNTAPSILGRYHHFFDTLRYQNCVRYSILDTCYKLKFPIIFGKKQWKSLYRKFNEWISPGIQEQR